MILTAIEPQKKRSDRVSLFLDDKFWLGISADLCQELDLRSGQEIGGALREKIENFALDEKALHFAVESLSRRMISSKQLEQKLLDKKYDAEVVEKTIRRCHDLHLLDDRFWAEAIARERKDRGQGRRRVEGLLRQAKITDHLIKEILEEVFPEEEARQQALLVLEKRYPTSINPDEQRRAYEMLLRRGFSVSAALWATEQKAMSPEEISVSWGTDQALDLLEKKFTRDKDHVRARRYLYSKRFSSEAIEEALRRFF